MKKGEHTPGPWTARPYNVNSGRVAEWSIDSKEWTHLALVLVQEDDTVTECDLGDGDANARLIAAAPDLLAACEKVLAILEDPGTYDAGKRLVDILPAYNAARAAIKKARGEK